MKDGVRRLLLYGAGLALAGVFAFVGFVYKPLPDIDTLVSCADMQMRMGQFGSAREMANQVLDRDPKNVQATLIAAYCAEQSQQLDEASSLYSAVLSNISDPDQIAEVRVALSLLEIQKKKPEVGLSWVQSFDSKNPRMKAKLDYARGYCRENLNQSQEAIALYKRAVDSADADVEIIRNASCRLEKLGETQEATRGLERAMGTGDLESKYLFSRLKFYSGDSDRASAVLQELSAKDARFLARRLQADDEFKKAVQSLGSLPGTVPGTRKE